MAEPVITDDDYDGSACPACGAEDPLCLGGTEVCGDGIIRLPMQCRACRATWSEMYSVCGYDDLEVAPEPEPVFELGPQSHTHRCPHCLGTWVHDDEACTYHGTLACQPDCFTVDAEGA